MSPELFCHYFNCHIKPYRARIQDLENRLSNVEAQLLNIQRPLLPLFSIEDNGTLAIGRMDFSFGNGNEQNNAAGGAWGFSAPVPYHIEALTLGSRVAVDGNGTEVELVINPTPNTNVNFSATGRTVAIPPASRLGMNTFTPFVVSPGQVVNVQTINPGGQDLVLTAWGRMI